MQAWSMYCPQCWVLATITGKNTTTAMTVQAAGHQRMAGTPAHGHVQQYWQCWWRLRLCP